MRHHITRTGLLFITFSDSTPEFNEYFPGLEELISTVDFTAFPFRTSLKYTGKYNWKTLIDGFQECLHCSFAHPSFSKVYAPTTYKVLNEQHFSRHFAEADCKRDSPSDGLFLYFFPNSTLNLYGGGISSFRTWPTDDPSKTIMQFDYYHKSSVETQEFQNYYKFARTVATEDNDLCEMAQMNLKVGIYTEGILNPNKENGVIRKSNILWHLKSFHRTDVCWVLDYQKRVFEMCLAEFNKETAANHEREKLDSSLDSNVSLEAAQGIV